MCGLGVLMAPTKQMKINFQSARLPTALALPLEKQDFGTSCRQLADYLNVRVYRIQGWVGCRKGRKG